MVYHIILPELTKSGIRYLTVGAIGALLNGYYKTTADLDLLVDLEENNLKRLLEFLKSKSYVPQVPVAPEELLQSEKRKEWYEKKNLRAFTFIDHKNPFGNIDLLIYTVIDFNEAWSRKQTVFLDETPVFVASIDDLILLKEDAIKNRDLQKDLYDLTALKELKRRTKWHTYYQRKIKNGFTNS